MAKFYLTTAIDYSNGDPHVGHTVEKVGADAIARYRRACGDDVHFVIGMDEHGQKVALEAESRGQEPREFVDEIAAAFLAVWSRLAISHDDFIRTSEPRHHRGVTELMNRIRDRGDFYQAKYEGYYCAGCEAFKKEDELAGGQCPIHPTREIEWTEEENWFFRLSAYGDRLLEHYAANPGFIEPESRRNEIQRFVEAGLDDISASRSRIRWGIPFPSDPEHTVYVWFDALSNYATAVGFPDGPDFERLWPAELHVIGKDITRFHCVYWPAMLMAAGVELPATVWGHGFLNVAGAKLSKSAGTTLGLDALVDRHGPDALRYFLLREIPWDSDRSWASSDEFVEQFDRRYTSDLANDLGNLLNRVVSMVSKYRGGAVPGGPIPAPAAEALARFRDHMDGYMLHLGLRVALELVRSANVRVDESRPWDLARAEREGGGSEPLDEALGSLVRTLGVVAAMLAPFIPGKAAELWRALGGEGPPPGYDVLADALAALARVAPGPILFPRPEEG